MRHTVTAAALAALLVCWALARPPGARAQAPDSAGPPPGPRPVATMSELMIDVLYPASDAVFYIETRTPTTTDEWLALETKTLMLAESANLLMTPPRARADARWMRDARLLLDAGEAAYRAAVARDVEALSDLNGRLYEACVRCHADFRRGYGRRP